MKALERGGAAECLRRVLVGREDVLLAYLFGSVVEKGLTQHDVDVAVLLKKLDPLEEMYALGELVVEVARALGVSEDKVDVVDLSRAPLALKYSILKQGVKLVGNEEAERGLVDELLLEYPDFSVELRSWIDVGPDPRVNPSVIESKVSEFRRNIEYLRAEVLSRPLDDLVSSYKDVLAMERAFQRAVESMLDVCRHLVSVHSLGLVESYSEYPSKLAERNLIPSDLAKELARLAGIRNILVHRYLSVRHEALYEAARDLVNRVYPRFSEWVGSL